MLTFDYPTWFLLFCALTGIAYATLFYYRETAFSEINKNWKRLFWTLRAAATTILAFLLLSPLLKTSQTETKKPVIVVAADNSQSIAMNARATDTLALHKQLKELATALGDNYDVRAYTFGSDVKDGLNLNYSDKVSNISKVFEDVYDNYTNQNLGAVIIATDGIYNQGANPLYTGQKLGVPIYTVALGDTTPKKDAVLKRVYSNQIAYLNDQFTIQIDIAAKNCSPANTTLTVSKGTATLKSQAIAIDKNEFFKTIDIVLNADAVGVQRYKIALSPINGEVTTANNAKEIVVEVIDAKQKVLLVANAPHPDLAALKQSILENKNYDLDIQYITDYKADAANYDLVIFHALPGTNGDAKNVLAQLAATKKPRWFILGNQSNLALFNQAQTVLKVSGSVATTNEVQATIAPNFQLFNLTQNTLTQLPKLPPLIAPFGEYTADPTATVLLNQKIGTVATKYPLWLLGEKDGLKTAVLTGEGIWKWRLQDFIQNKKFDNINDLVTQNIQYLTVKEDKRKFRAFTNKTVYDENENIIIDAELYNDSYQRINEPDAKLMLTDEKGKDYAFTFSKVSNYYTANIGLLPTGDYTYKANTSFQNQNLSANGSFSVKAIQLESFETTADHRLLRTLSATTDAQTVPPTQVSKIAELIKAKASVKPTLYSTLKTRSLIDEKWIFILLLSLLSLEWFLRKYHGGY